MVCPPTLKKNGVRKSALFLYKEEIIKTFLGERKKGKYKKYSDHPIFDQPHH